MTKRPKKPRMQRAAPTQDDGPIFLVNDIQIAFDRDAQLGLLFRLRLASMTQPHQTFVLDEECGRFLLTRLKECFGEAPLPLPASRH